MLNQATTYSNSHNSNVPHLTTRWLAPSKFKELKADHHKIVNQIIEQKGYKIGIAKTLRDLLNCCDKSGMTKVTLNYLSCLNNGRNEKTIRRHLNQLQKDGVIERYKTGWMQSSITIILAIQHLNSHIVDIMSDYLTSPSLCPSDRERGREQEKKKNASALPKGREASDKDALNTQIIIQSIEITEEEREIAKPHIQSIRNLLKSDSKLMN